MKLITPAVASILLFTNFLPLAAQGEWSPSEATFTRPRLFFSPEDVTPLRTRVQQGPYIDLYTSIWHDAMTAELSGDLFSDVDRRRNARLAKGIAFVLFVRKRPPGSQVVEMTVVEREILTSRLDSLFALMNGTVDPEDPESWDGRAIELIDYLAAWDIAVALELDNDLLARVRDSLVSFTGDLHYAAVYQRTGQIPLLSMHDHRGLIICGALGSAAIVLNDVSDPIVYRQPTTWINDALWWSNAHLWASENRLSERGIVAGFAEGPGHMRNAFRALLPFYRSLSRVYPVDSIEITSFDPSITIPHPFYDPDFDSLYLWAASLLNPDGTMPSIEQTHVNQGFPELAITGRTEYVRSVESRFTDLTSTLLDDGIDRRVEYIVAGTTPSRYPTGSLNRVYPAAGNVLFRSGRAPDDWALGFIAENGRARTAGDRYDQGDAGNFYIVEGDQPLSYDPGYLREEMGDGASHNLVLVDGAAPGAGDSSGSHDADATIEAFWTLDGVWNRFFDRSLISYTRIRTGYLGAEFTRHGVMIDGAYAIIADDIRSDDPHTYTWQLHGYMPDGTIDTISGGFTLNSDAREADWRNGAQGLSAHVASSDPDDIWGSTGNVHELNAQTTGPHQTLQVETSEPVTSAQFIAALAPRPIENDLMFSSEQSQRGASVISRVTGEHHFFALAPDTTWRTIPGFESSLPFDIETDARFIGAEFSPFGEKPYRLFFMVEGTQLNVDSRPLLSTTARMDVCIFNNRDSEFFFGGGIGYVSDSGVLRVAEEQIYFPYGRFSGPTVTDVMHLPATGYYAIEFSGPGHFRWDGPNGVPDEDVESDRSEASAASIAFVERNGDALDVGIELREELHVTVILYRIDGTRIAEQRLRANRTGTESIRFTLPQIPSGPLMIAVEADGRVVDARIETIVR